MRQALLGAPAKSRITLALIFLIGAIVVTVSGARLAAAEKGVTGDSISKPTEASQALSSVYTEQAIVIPSRPQFPLDGTLTRPVGDVKATVVLVPGSGPQNRDEEIGANRPFYDLAHGLASRGFAVLRFDKVTFTYGGVLATDPDVRFWTVEDEIVTDVVNAIDWLKNQEGLPSDQIFLLGHSLGGSLLAHIDAQGTNASGYVLMASSSRPMWEISLDQNLALIDEMQKQGQHLQALQARAIVAAEKRKAERLDSMSDDALRNQMVFGAPAVYQKFLSDLDPIDLHLKNGKPVLILHGKADRQVTETDFYLWESGLASHPNATFKLYPNLNHLFGQFKGERPPLTQLVTTEYAQATPIPDYVIDDIASWLSAQLH